MDGIDRLVLLGDIVELTEGRPAAAMRIAEPVLRALGERMHGREIVLVPGNHDRPLIRDWARRHARELSSETAVPPHVTPLLARVCELLGVAQVRVRYPGYWLDDDVWATHGHYLNRHLTPHSTVGMRRDWVGQPSSARAPADYEVRRGSRRERSADETSWRRRLGRGLLGLPRLVLDPSLAPLTARLLGVQLTQAGIPAMLRVIEGLRLEARFVVFGHLHRLGPLPGDDAAAWSGAGGRPRLLNTGSWLYEPLLVHRATPPNPYWPGGAVLVEPGEEPRAIGLLDDVDAAALRPVAS